MLARIGSGAVRFLIVGGGMGTSGSGIFGGGAGGPSEGIDFRGMSFGYAANALPWVMGTVVAVVVTGPLVVVVVVGRFEREEDWGRRAWYR
jgi:hypothetical protein